uniref:Uncharacterized protein n=1 Tax=viral metagenome TaxID=1070528 RepID=A0A6C0HWC6_9ZZZZ
MVSLQKIMKHINKFKYTDDIFNYMDNINIDVNSIFNKSEEQLQVDFIKLLLSKMKEDIKFVLVLTISNINTFKTLLEWGIKYDDYNLCYFLFHHKDKNIILTNKDYTLYEEKTKNKKIALLINEFKLKDSYDDSTDSSDDSTDSSDFFDSSDSSDLDDFDSDHSDVD